MKHSMRYIKVFEKFKNNSKLEKSIALFVHKYPSLIENYTINADGTIDVDGDVEIDTNGEINKIPFKFGKVSGNFSCHNNRLKSLEGCPYYVGGDFDCSSNKLKTLKYSPSEVGGGFDCTNNELESLEGMSLEIGGYFDCRFQNRKLKELDSVSNIEGEIICDDTVDTSKFGGYCKDITILPY